MCSSKAITIGTATRLTTLSHTLTSVLHSYHSRPFICMYNTATQQPGVWTSYHDFYRIAITIGSRLAHECNLKIGDRVGIATANCEEWFLIELACSLYGFVSVGLPHISPTTLVSLVDDFKINVLFATNSNGFLAEQLSSTVTLLDPVQWCRQCGFGAKDIIPPVTYDSLPTLPLLSDDLLYTIILTSGSSTGRPKGVKYTRRMWNTDMVSYPSPSLRAISYLPTSHIVDRHHVSVTMFNGGEVVVVDAMDKVFSALPIINPTILFITPVLSDQLLRLPSVGECLKIVVCVAGGISEGIAAALTEKWGVQVVNPYGLTDIGNIAVNGRLIDGILYKVRPVHGDNLTELSSDDLLRGELLVKQHFEGYDENSDAALAHTNATSVTDSDGYFCTGDIVEVNPKSKSIVICGRVNDKVKMPNGEWIFPSQIEDAVEHHRSLALRYPVSDIFIDTRSGSNIICAIVHMSCDQLMSNDEILHTINSTLKHAGISCQVNRVITSEKPFTVENELRNHSLKLNRFKLRMQFQDELDEIFAHSAESKSIVVRVAEYIAGVKNDLSCIMTFRSLGGDSLAALQVKHILKSDFNIDDNRVVAALLNAKYTLADVKAVILSPPRFYSREHFMRNISRNIRSRNSSRCHDSTENIIFVTGAGGIIGRHVVSEMVDKSRDSGGSQSLRVVCLVREKSYSDVREMFKNMKEVEVIEGDVSMPQLGLGDGLYQYLAASVTHIFHCAGNTNQALEYEDLTSNLVSTAEVLMFASAAKRRCSSVIVSTTDILSVDAPECFPLEETDSRLPNEMTGYAQMKLHEESIVSDAVVSGLEGTVVCRLGLVCNSTKPWPPKYDFIDILFQAIHEMGAVPNIPKSILVPSLLPADVAANWIVTLACSAYSQNKDLKQTKIYHLTNHNDNEVKYSDIFQAMSLPIMTMENWIASVPTGSPLHSLLFQADRGTAMIFGNNGRRSSVVTTRTMSVLKDIGAYPAPSVKSLIERVVVQSGKCRLQ